MASTNQLAEEEETCLAEAELEPTCLDDQARYLAPTSQRVPVLGAGTWHTKGHARPGTG